MDEVFVKFFLGEVNNIPLHRFHGLEIFFLVRGEAILEVDGQKYKMETEDIIVCHTDNLRAMQSGAPNITLRILLAEEYLKSETGIPSTNAFECNSVSSKNCDRKDFFELRRIITRLIFAHYSNQDERQLETKSLLFQLLLLLKTAFYSKFTEQKEGVPPNADKRIESALAYIDRNFRNPITLQDVADRIGFSVHYLSRLFKRQTGKGFLEYLGELRLQSSVTELTSSKESILKIALDNGFSNATSFNRIFQKRFGMTPVRYRTQNQNREENSLLKVEEFSPHPSKVGHEFLKYLARFDLRHTEEDGEHYRHKVDMSAQSSAVFSLPPKIVKVGKLAELLKHEVREQLKEARAKLDFSSLHFQVLFDDGIHHYGELSFYNFYEYESALTYIIELGFEPILQIDAAAFFAEAEHLGSPERCFEHFSMFLSNCIKRWGIKKIDQWQFEIYGSDIHIEIFYHLYRAIREIIRSLSETAKVGFSAPISANMLEDEQLSILLELCLQKNITVDFITLYTYPLKHFELDDDEAYLAYRSYHRNIVTAARKQLDAKGLHDCGIVMMDWNTLTGTGAHANFYYRAAVILDAILSIHSDVQGIGFWLNSHMYEAITGTEDNTILAVFVYMQMKRPTYFILSLLTKLRPHIIYSDRNLIVTLDEEGVYTLLAHNPSYFNPAYAADAKFLESRKCVLDLELEQWGGSYIFERYVLDIGNGSVYNKWAQMGFPSLFQPETAEYLEMIVKPNLSIFGENVKGVYTIFHEMQFNAVLLYVIKPA